MTPDIVVTNQSGFFTLQGVTPKGAQWMKENVQEVEHDTAYSDDSRYAWDICQGAIEAGLVVV